jgi:hypothetical protein
MLCQVRKCSVGSATGDGACAVLLLPCLSAALHMTVGDMAGFLGLRSLERCCTARFTIIAGYLSRCGARDCCIRYVSIPS